MTTMTKEEFLEQYAGQSGVSVQWLLDNGQEAYPCKCGDSRCKGWQLLGGEEIRVMRELGLLRDGDGE
jgi:hypothetical protein